MSLIAAQGPAGPWRVVFDGQSHNLVPGLAPDFPYSNIIGPGYPGYLMAGRGVPWANVAIGGTAWSTLATDAATRLFPIAGSADQTVLILNGGHTDIHEGDTAQQVYDDAAAYAAAARAAGFSHVVMCTITGNDLNTAGQELVRQAVNPLLLADASAAFDTVVDIAAVPGLDDWTNETYYLDIDHIHWTGAGASLAAATVAPVLDAILAG